MGDEFVVLDLSLEAQLSYQSAGPCEQSHLTEVLEGQSDSNSSSHPVLCCCPSQRRRSPDQSREPESPASIQLLTGCSQGRGNRVGYY